MDIATYFLLTQKMAVSMSARTPKPSSNIQAVSTRNGMEVSKNARKPIPWA